MAATKTEKIGEYEWEIRSDDTAETWTVVKQGRNYLIRSGDDQVGEATSLKAAGETVAEWIADQGGQSTGPRPPVNPPSDTGDAGEPNVWLWSEPDGQGGAHVMRSYPHRSGPRSILRVPEAEVEDKLRQQVEFHRGQGLNVAEGAPDAR